MKNDKITFRECAEKMIEVFGDNAKVGLCFLVAATFRKIIRDELSFFPILHLYGTIATGKTEMGHSLTSFFDTCPQRLNINNMTEWELADVMSEKSNVIVHIDEYRNNINARKKENLKGIWHGSVFNKGERKAVNSACIMSGQDIPDIDEALFNRMLVLKFPKASFTEDNAAKLKELQTICKNGVTHLPVQIMNYREYFREYFIKNWNEVLADMTRLVHVTNTCEDRILKNWAVLLSSFRCMEMMIKFPMSYYEMLEICLFGYKEQLG